MTGSTSRSACGELLRLTACRRLRCRAGLRPGVRLLVTVALSTGLLAACSSNSPAPQHSAAHHPANDTYGSLPAFLPKNTVHNDAAIVGRVDDPAVTSEGDVVRARTAHGDVAVQVSGPQVPGEGLPEQAAATTCTWRVIINGASAPIGIDPQDFNTLDHLGTVYRVHPVAGQPKIPRTLQPGQRISFELRAVMPTGEGLMRWAPDGRHIVAEWDFTVEND